MDNFQLKGKFTIELIKSDGSSIKIGEGINEISQSGSIKEGSRLLQNNDQQSSSVDVSKICHREN